MNLIKTFTNSENKITHVEIALSHTEDEITTTVSDIFELREAVEEPITEEQAIKVLQYGQVNIKLYKSSSY